MSIYLRLAGGIVLEIQSEMIKKTKVSEKHVWLFHGRALDSGRNCKRVKQAVTEKIPTFPVPSS